MIPRIPVAWTSHAWSYDSYLELSYLNDSLMCVEDAVSEQVDGYGKQIFGSLWVRTLGPISPAHEHVTATNSAATRRVTLPANLFQLCLAPPSPSLLDTLPYFVPNPNF